jgi:hypothetical protein
LAGVGGFAVAGVLLGTVMFGDDIDFNLDEDAQGNCVSMLRPDHRRKTKTGNVVYWDVKNKCEPLQLRKVAIKLNDATDCGAGSHLSGEIEREGIFYCNVAYVPPIGEVKRRTYKVVVGSSEVDPELEIRGRDGRFTFEELLEHIRALLSYFFD